MRSKFAVAIHAVGICFIASMVVSNLAYSQMIEPKATAYEGFWKPSDIVDPNSLEPIENVYGNRSKRSMRG